MRRAALMLVCAASALSAQLVTELAQADCSTPTGPCVDAEPLWLTPASQRFTVVSDAPAVEPLRLAASASLGFRWRPGVLHAPAPNRQGRDVNVIRYSTDASLGVRFGLGRGMELTLSLPAGLYQRGAGIKGVTYQSAPPIPEQSLHDPRLGFGHVLPELAPWLRTRWRFELKLPLGSAESLAGEDSFVASPSIALLAHHGGAFAGVELGARLRQASDFYGSRVGSQALVALGIGYQLDRPRIALTLEAYALPSLIAAGTTRYLPAEWLGTMHFTPASVGWLGFGAGSGTGLRFSHDSESSFAAFGVPSFRVLGFVRLTPGAD